MDRWKGSTRKWEDTSGPTVAVNNKNGATFFHERNMHRTPSLTPQQNSLPSNVSQPPLFPWSGEPSVVPTVDEWIRRSERVCDSAHVRLQRAIWAQRTQADQWRCPHPNYQPESLVIYQGPEDAAILQEAQPQVC